MPSLHSRVDTPEVVGNVSVRSNPSASIPDSEADSVGAMSKKILFCAQQFFGIHNFMADDRFTSDQNAERLRFGKNLLLRLSFDIENKRDRRECAPGCAALQDADLPQSADRTPDSRIQLASDDTD